MTPNRAEALARRDIFVGEWVMAAEFPGGQRVRSRFEWTLDRQFRLYQMSLAEGMWTLTREAPDFTPLDFRQRFTGTFSADGNVISGAWEKAAPGSGSESRWERDFVLSYRRAGAG